MAASGVRVVRRDRADPASEQEAEARMHREGYEVFRWHDPPGSEYPRHRHEEDELLWVIEGRIRLAIEGAEHALDAGDRLYLSARVPHTALVPDEKGCTYLVGRKPGGK